MIMERLHTWFPIKTVRVIEWTIPDADDLKPHGRVMEVSKAGDKLSWQSSTPWHGQKELHLLLKKKKPTILLIHGKGVIFKILNGKIQSIETGLHQVMGSRDTEAFYMDAVPDENQSLVAIMRRSALDLILESLKSTLILDVMLGPVSLSVFPQKLIQESSIKTDHYMLEKRPEGWHLVPEKSTVQKEIIVFDKSITSEEIHLLAAGSQFLFYINDELKTDLNRFSENRKEKLFQQLFYSFSKVSALLIFATLLLNLFVANRLEKEYMDLNVQLTALAAQHQQVQQMKENLEMRKTLLKNSGFSANYRASIIIDQIAATVPKDILLNRLEVNPLAETLKKKKAIRFSTNRIYISGQAPNSTSLNHWIAELEVMDACERVRLERFEEDKYMSIKDFTLEIKLKS